MRDDDLSIPVLADVLEPGDPAKADPAVPRRPIPHAWTDALALDREPLGAVPTLSEVLAEGDPRFTHPSPQPADAALNIPLLNDVLSYRDAVGPLSLRDETRGAPIPLLTDVLSDDVERAAARGDGSGVADDIPVLTDVASHEDDIPVLTDVASHEDDIPVLHDVAEQEDDIPVLHDVAEQDDGIPVLHDVAAHEDDIPVLHEVAAHEDDIPVLHDAAAHEDDIPVLHDVAAHEDDIPVLHEVAAHEDDIPVLHDVAEQEDEARALHDVAPETAEIPVPSELAHEPADIPVLSDAVHEASDIPVLNDIARELTDVPMFAQAANEAHATHDSGAVPAFEEHADAEALAALAQTAPDLHALASSTDAHLFDPELPFRAYCSFPGEKALEPLASGESAVPPMYPMARVPQPFGSASDAHDVEPQPDEAPAIGDIAAAELDPRDFGDHQPHRLVDTTDHTLDAVASAPDLRDFGHAEPVATSLSADQAEELESVYSEPPFTTSDITADQPTVSELATADDAVSDLAAVTAAASVAAEPHIEPDVAATHTAAPAESDQVHGDLQLGESAFAELELVDHEALDAVTDPFTPIDTSSAHQAEDAANARPDESTAEAAAAMAAASIAAPALAAEPTPAPEHGAVMADDEADHVAAVLARHEPIAAELTLPEPEPLAAATAAPTASDLERVAANVGERALRYLNGEGHSLIEERCQEQAVWLAHRITREIAASLEREIGQWVQQAIRDALEHRDPTK